MKNYLSLFLMLSLATFSGYNCKKAVNSTNSVEKISNNGCYKGRLEIKGLCMNYTIKVLQGNIDKSLIVESWKDENTGKIYQDVFALSNKCSLPSTLKEGDEFYFTINNNTVEDCMVCQAFYPTPSKKLSISVRDAACN